MKDGGFDKPEDSARMKKQAAKAMLGQLVASFFTASVLAWFIGVSGNTTAFAGAHTAFGIWFGFLAMNMISGVLFEKRSWTWFAINGGNTLVTMLVMGAILGGWR